MSKLFKYFEKKHKDAKYGKGHKLSETSGPTPSSPRGPTATISPREAAGEASRMAGEAALARMTQKPVYKKAISTTSDNDEKKALSAEMRKAEELKEHYFGAPKVIDASPFSARVLFKSDLVDMGASYPKDEIEDRIEQALMLQLDEDPILVSVTLLFTANKAHPSKVAACCEILNKFINNIVNAPGEEKYRKIRLENAIFKEKVYALKYSDLVMKMAGFKARTVTKSTPSQQTANVYVLEEEDAFVFESDNLDSLLHLREMLAIGEPVLPQLDRDVQVWHAVTPAIASKFDLPSDFYNLTVQELMREQKARDEQLEKLGTLRTKAMRERDEQLELRRYNYCLCRIRFPNDYVLQGLFKASETYQDLCDFVREHLEYDELPFEVFGHAIRKGTTAKSTLSEAGLAPAALLSFKWADACVQELTVSRDPRYQLRTTFLKRSLLEGAKDL